MSDNKYEQFLPIEEEEVEPTPLDIEKRLNALDDERYNASLRHRTTRPSSRGVGMRTTFQFAFMIKKLIIYTYNKIKYGYFGDM